MKKLISALLLIGIEILILILDIPVYWMLPVFAVSALCMIIIDIHTKSIWKNITYISLVCFYVIYIMIGVIHKSSLSPIEFLLFTTGVLSGAVPYGKSNGK